MKGVDSWYHLEFGGMITYLPLPAIKSLSHQTAIGYPFHRWCYGFNRHWVATRYPRIAVRQASDTHRIGNKCVSKILGGRRITVRWAIGQTSDRHRIAVGQASDSRRIGIRQASDRHRISIPQKKICIFDPALKHHALAGEQLAEHLQSMTFSLGGWCEIHVLIAI